jgi:phosphoribosylaminoimidazole-succinocarboxamide synthase
MEKTIVTTAKSSDMTLSYEGSVKRVWQSDSNPDKLWFEFTDDYSVFDWGKMPDHIANKGRALALIGAYCFEELAKPSFWQTLPESKHLLKFDPQFLQNRWWHRVFAGRDGLSKKGLLTHFTGLTDEHCQPLTLDQAIKTSGKLLMEVTRANVYRPVSHRILHHNLFFYPQPETKTADTKNSRTNNAPSNNLDSKNAHLHNAHAHNADSKNLDTKNLNTQNPETTNPVTTNPDTNNQVRLIPLEIVFRFGMPAGSSLVERLSTIPDYLRSLGFSTSPKANEWFSHPVLEFFTKLEPKDRFLSWQEAAVLSGLSPESFEELTEIAMDTAIALHEIFARHGMELWDGKVEMVESITNDPNHNQVSQILLADSIGPDELRVMLKGKQLSKEMIRQFYRGSNWEQSLKDAQKLAKDRAELDWKKICSEELHSNPDPLSNEFKTEVDKLYGVLTNTLIGQAAFANHPDIDQFALDLDGVMSAKSK